MSPGAPLALVRVESIAQVQATMRWAVAHDIPVVPRGAGTGLAGGAIGSVGEIVLDRAHDARSRGLRRRRASRSSSRAS
ncbi:MAG: FAD-binding protein [Schumannella sp.]